MKLYTKDNEIKYANRIVVIKDGMQIISPTEEQILDDGWVEYVAPEPEPAQPRLEPSSFEVQNAVSLMMLPQARAAFAELDDQEALKVKELADTWASKINTEVEVGLRLWYDNKLYKVKQKHTVLEIYPPSLDTASLYEVIDETHAGTQEDPIPYTPPMEIFNGKYYTQNDILYKCTRDSEIALTHDLSALVGIYVELV